jgi:hypothetical protein
MKKWIYYFKLLAIAVFFISGAIPLSAQTWSSIDGGGTTGINTNAVTVRPNSKAVMFNGALYAIWEETSVIHIKKFDGSTWTGVGTTPGTTQLSTTGVDAVRPELIVYNGALYAAYENYNSVGSNYGIHVKKFDGSSWTPVNHYVKAYRTDININFGETADAYHVSLAVFNNKLYASWVESRNITGIYQIRVSAFDGTNWAMVDGDAEPGLNYDVAKSVDYANNHKLTVYNNQLYLSWKEVNTTTNQLRVRRYNNDAGNTWTFVDGNLATGLNYNTGKAVYNHTAVVYNGNLIILWGEAKTVTDNRFFIHAKKYDGTTWTVLGIDWNKNTDPNVSPTNPNAMVYNNKLYVTWDEQDDTTYKRQIRVASYDGTARTFIDGNGAYGINQNTAYNAQMPILAEHNGILYAVWHEDISGSNNNFQIRAKSYPLPPIVTSVQVPANKTYIIGESLNFTVNYNKAVDISGGTPYIPLTLNTGGTVNANYVSGSGTQNLVFSYTVSSGNIDADGVTLGSSIVLPSGTTLLSNSIVNATLNLNETGNTSGVLVDGVSPEVGSIVRQTPTQSTTLVTTVIYRINFSESIKNLDITDFNLTTTGSVNASIASVSASTGNVSDVTVNISSGTGTLRLDLKNSGTGITDIPGNTIAGYTSSEIYTIAQLPEVSTLAALSITSTTATGNGNITNLGYPNPSQYGVVWGTAANPDISLGTKTQEGTCSATGTFTSNITGLQAFTTYHIRAYATNDAGTSYGADETFTTDRLTVTYNGSWDPSEPTGNEYVIINGDYSGAGFTCKSLTVNAGKQFTLASGSLSVNGTMTLKSDATNGTATFLDNGNSFTAASFKVEQNISGLRNWYVSSPVANAVVNTVFTDYSTAYKYDETKNAQSSTDYWVAAGTSTMETMRGYTVKVPADKTYTFAGSVLNTGDKNIALTRTGSGGFNLVGNPYPSYLKWSDLYSYNSTIISPTLWYRTRNTSDLAYVFVSFNGAGDLLVNPSGRTIDENIPPMQAFWVRATTAGTLNATNDMRLHHNTKLVKGTTANTILRLQASNGKNADETVIYFNEAAANAIDDFDSPKMFNASTTVPDVYTLQGNDKFVINGLKDASVNTDVKLGLSVNAAGTITLKASEIANFSANTSIMLEDVIAGKKQDLRLNPEYSFTCGVETLNDRFIIHFVNATTGINDKEASQNIKVYAPEAGKINISATNLDDQHAKVMIYNQLGQQMHKGQLSGSLTILSHSFAPGVYLVNISTGSKTVTHKVVVQ